MINQAETTRKYTDERLRKKDGLHLTIQQKQFDSNPAPLIYTQRFGCLSGKDVNIQHIEKRLIFCQTKKYVPIPVYTYLSLDLPFIVISVSLYEKIF